MAADVWSVTSYKELHRDALEAERWNVLHPSEKPKTPFVSQCLGDAQGPIVAASDYLKVLPDSVCRWMPRKILALGTDGFGRSDGRERVARFLRSGCPLHRAGDAVVPGMGQEDQTGSRFPGDEGARTSIPKNGTR